MNVRYINSISNKCLIEFEIEEMQELLGLVYEAQSKLKWTDTQKSIAQKWSELIKKTMFVMYDNKI